MRKNAFTIVELLVTIVIISILSVIVIGQYRQSMMKANDVRRKADLNSLYKALLMVYNDSGVFPTNASIDWGGELKSGETVYMKQVPEDSNVALPYFVQTDVDQKKMAIFANLENTEDSEYNRYCPNSNGYSAENGNVYHYVIFSSNTSADDFPISCE